MINILKTHIILPDYSKPHPGTTAKVVIPDGESEVFEIMSRVLQGDTLAPYALKRALKDHEDLSLTITPRCS